MNLRRRIIINGDNIMVRPEDAKARTRSGLYLPASVADSEKVMAGWVVEVGPGIALPDPIDPEEESWKQRRDPRPRHLPPQAEEGDVAIFLRKAAVEIEYDGQEYLIVPNAAVLALLREELAPPAPRSDRA